MPVTTPDGRFAFKRTLLVGPTAILEVEVFNGPIIQLQAVVFSKDRQPLSGIGTPQFGAPRTSEHNGIAGWLFDVPAEASYIKWGLRAFRSAANNADYGITSKIRDGASGDTIEAARFNAVINDDFVDDWIYDGVFLRRADAGDIQAEPRS